MNDLPILILAILVKTCRKLFIERIAMSKQTPITTSANGEECQIRIPFICNHNPETTVWCHANGLSSGKGYGMKSHDALGAYGCSSCHDVVDGKVKVDFLTRNEIQLAFHEGHQRSFLKLIEKGLVKV